MTDDLINEKQSPDNRYKQHKSWGVENVDQRRAQRQRQRERDKANGLTHERAREAVRQATEKGILVRPAVCERCKKEVGKDNIVAHHHVGYDKPLAVKWYCTKCHAEVDNNKDGDDTYTGKAIRRGRHENDLAEDIVQQVADLITDDPDVFVE